MATAEENANSASAALFGKFKTDVADRFKRDHAVRVAACFNLTPAKRDEIRHTRKPGLTLLNHLQDDDIINEDSIQKLCDALEFCHLKGIARKAKEEFDKYMYNSSRGKTTDRDGTDGTDTGYSFSSPETLRNILQNYLTRENCFELAIYFSLPDHVVNKVQESASYADELLDTMESRTIISKENISPLLRALKDRGLLRVVNEIKATCEEHHIVTYEEEGPTALEEGSGDSVKCRNCGSDKFEEFEYNGKLVAIECLSCPSNWMATPSSTYSERATMTYNNQTLTYNPPVKLDLSKLKYEEVKDINELHSADHIILRRIGTYDHHAILVCSKGSSQLEVIHWTTSDSGIKIEKGDISFPSGGVKRAIYDKEDPVELVLARAFRKLKDPDESYSLADNNCESLATYCKCGNYYSVQGEFVKNFMPGVQRVIMKLFNSNS